MFISKKKKQELERRIAVLEECNQRLLASITNLINACNSLINASAEQENRLRMVEDAIFPPVPEDDSKKIMN